MFEKTTATVISFLFALTLAGCASTSKPPKTAPATPASANPPVQAASTAPLEGGNETAAKRSPTGPTARIRPSAPRRYVVKKGDTLWGIAGMFLHKPWYWPEIWHANPEIRNPHLIYPEDVLTLHYKGGRPYVQISGGPRVEGGYHTEKLLPTVRSEALEDTRRVIPIQVVQQLIFQPHVLEQKQIDAAPYIVSGEEYGLVFSSGDILYIRNLDQDSTDRLYSVVHPGPALKHHVTGEVLGYAMDPVGVVELLAGGDPATGRLLDIKREALTGDRLLHHELEHPNRDFMPHAPKRELDGAVIHLFDAISMIGQLQVAVVDLGTRDDIDRGTVLRTFKTGPMIHDPLIPLSQRTKIKLPNEPAALLMVFSTFEKLSYALVMEAKRPVEVGDTIHSPIRTEPAADVGGPTEARRGTP